MFGPCFVINHLAEDERAGCSTLIVFLPPCVCVCVGGGGAVNVTFP